MLLKRKVCYSSGFLNASTYIFDCLDDEENAYIVEEVQRELTLWERDEHTPYSTNLPKMLNYLKVAQAFAADDDD